MLFRKFSDDSELRASCWFGLAFFQLCVSVQTRTSLVAADSVDCFLVEFVKSTAIYLHPWCAQFKSN